MTRIRTKSFIQTLLFFLINEVNIDEVGAVLLRFSTKKKVSESWQFDLTGKCHVESDAIWRLSFKNTNKKRGKQKT